MKANEQLLALQNMARNTGSAVEIHQKQSEDKRKTRPLFFAQLGEKTVSPVLDYTGLNCFLMGAAANRPNGRIYDNGDVEQLDKSHDELLAALKGMLALWEELHAGKPDYNAYNSPMKAAQAIAKATGK